MNFVSENLVLMDMPKIPKKKRVSKDIDFINLEESIPFG
jgi:hypothetical protein